MGWDGGALEGCRSQTLGQEGPGLLETLGGARGALWAWPGRSAGEHITRFLHALVLSLFFPHFEGPDAPSMLCPHLCASVFKATPLSPGGSSQVPCHCGVWSSSPTTTLSLSEHSFLPWTGPSRLRTLPQCGCCPWRLSELLWYLRHLIPGPLSMLLLCGHKNTSLPAPKVLGRHWYGVGTVGEPDLVKSSIKGLWAEDGSWERRSGL